MLTLFFLSLCFATFFGFDFRVCVVSWPFGLGYEYEEPLELGAACIEFVQLRQRESQELKSVTYLRETTGGEFRVYRASIRLL